MIFKYNMERAMGVGPTSQAWEDLTTNFYKPLKIEWTDFFDETFDETFCYQKNTTY